MMFNKCFFYLRNKIKVIWTPIIKPNSNLVIVKPEYVIDSRKKKLVGTWRRSGFRMPNYYFPNRIIKKGGFHWNRHTKK